MKRKKKITIRHFLNTKLKAGFNFGGDEIHPSYTRITYDRNNTIFFMDWNSLYNKNFGSSGSKFTKEGFDNFLNNTDTKIYVENTNKIIKGIIRYEEIIFKDDFELKGFRNRLEFFHIHLNNLWYQNTVEEIFEALKGKINRTKYLMIRQKYGLFDEGLLIEMYVNEKKSLFDDYKNLLPDILFQKLRICYLIYSLELILNKKITVFDWYIDGISARFFDLVGEDDIDAKHLDFIENQLVPTLLDFVAAKHLDLYE